MGVRRAYLYSSLLSGMVALLGCTLRSQEPQGPPEPPDPSAPQAQVEVRAMSFEQRLQSAQALLEQGRAQAARAAFVELREMSPKDARVVAGLARTYEVEGEVEGEGELELDTLSAVLCAERELHHRDKAYYEIFIGVCGAKLYADAVSALMENRSQEYPALKGRLDEVYAQARMYAELGGERAVVIGELAQAIREGVPMLFGGEMLALKRHLFARLLGSIELQKRTPTSRQSFTLALFAAEFLDDRREAWDVVWLAEGDGSQWSRWRKAHALLNLSVLWRDDVFWTAAASLVNDLADELDDEGRPELQEEVDWALLNLALLSLLFEDDREIAEEVPRAIYRFVQKYDSPVALNALGVVLWNQGEHHDARSAFTEAVHRGGEQARIARLNLAIATEDVGDLEKLASDEETHTAVTIYAMRWLEELSRGRARVTWRKRRQALEAREDENPFFRERASAIPGWMFGAELTFHIGHSDAYGLIFDLNPMTRPWLVLCLPKARGGG